MTWQADLDTPGLVPTNQIFHDMILACNERSDAARIDRPFYDRSGNPSVPLSGGINLVTIIFAPVDTPKGFQEYGTLRIIEDENYDEFKYTTVSGSGTVWSFVVDTTLTGSYTEDAVIDIMQIDETKTDLFPTNDIMSVLTDKIDELIPYYVDHTQATGNEFIGLTEAPIWNEADMLTSIGDDERITSGPLWPVGTWAAQSYKIINKLLWTNALAQVRQRYRKIATEDTWPEIVAAWPSTEWGEISLIGTGLTAYGRRKLDGTYVAIRNYIDWRYPTNSNLVHVADLYLYVEAGSYIFDGEGLFNEDEWQLAVSNAPASVRTGEIDTTDTMNQDQVPPQPTAINSIKGWFSPDQEQNIILRFDVEGGFSYT